MFRFYCIIIYSGFILTNTYANPVDSLGIEKRYGKILVQHKVEKGETLYAILKRYDCSEKEFLSVNSEFKKGTIIAPEQVIEIPIKGNKVVKKTSVIDIIETQATKKDKKNIDENGIEIVDVPEATPKEIVHINEKVRISDSSTNDLTINDTIEKPTVGKAPIKKKTHIVVVGQNLFTISKLYKLKVWQIREWNSLTNDALKENQVLAIEKPAYYIAKVAKKDTLRSKSEQVQAPAGDMAVKDKRKEKAKDQTLINKPYINKPPATVVPNAPGGKKFSEQGIAEMIDAGEGTNKFLALHRTAPIGTLIKVANQANRQSVWVKVIGKLSSPGDVVIKISPKAFEKLSQNDKRIRAELSYSVSNQ